MWACYETNGQPDQCRKLRKNNKEGGRVNEQKNRISNWISGNCIWIYLLSPMNFVCVHVFEMAKSLELDSLGMFLMPVNYSQNRNGPTF